MIRLAIILLAIVSVSLGIVLIIEHVQNITFTITTHRNDQSSAWSTQQEHK